MSLWNPVVDVNTTTNSYVRAMSIVCCTVILCEQESSRRLSGSMPAGYVSHTGYQYDSTSRVAGQREPAPASKPSKLGGFRNNVLIRWLTETASGRNESRGCRRRPTPIAQESDSDISPAPPR